MFGDNTVVKYMVTALPQISQGWHLEDLGC